MSEDDKNQAPSERRRDFSNLRAVGITTFAILLYLLLLDAAIETFLNDSPLKWWVVGIVGAYAGLSVLLWRRIGWAAKAALSLFVLLGLLAFTAWWPEEGLTKGVVLARQPTSTVLSAVTALAILLAGIGLMRLKIISIWGRVVIGLLALYGVAAFVLGIVTGTSYSDLFHGRSLWEGLPSWLQQLPFWLQGAFVGAVVVLLAFLVQFIYGLLRVRGEALRLWGVQVLVLGVSLMIAAAALKMSREVTTSATLVGTPSPSAGVSQPTTGTRPPEDTTPSPTPPGATSSPKPKVEAVLAKGITEANEPKEVTTQFTDVDERIYVVLNTALPKGAQFTAKWIALNAEGIEPQKKVAEACLPYIHSCGLRKSDHRAGVLFAAITGKEGPRWVLWYEAWIGGFAPGDYRVDLQVQCRSTQPCVDAKSSLTFKVTSSVPAAASAPPPGSPSMMPGPLVAMPPAASAKRGPLKISDVAIALDEAGRETAFRIAHDREKIYALWKLTLETHWKLTRVSSGVEVQGRLVAPKVMGIDANMVVSSSRQMADRDGVGRFALLRPPGGWKPGRYRVEVAAGGSPPGVAEFLIIPPTPALEPGVARRDFGDQSYNSLIASAVDQRLELDWSTPSPGGARPRVWVEWEGVLTPPVSGRYEFTFEGESQGFLYIDGRQVIQEIKVPSDAHDEGLDKARPSGLSLDAVPHTIRVGVMRNGSGTFAVKWKRIGDPGYSSIDPQYLRHRRIQREWRRTPRQAAQVGLERLQSTAVEFQRKNKCYACHVQSHAIRGLSVAEANNYVVAEEYFKELVEFVKRTQEADGSWTRPSAMVTATQYGAMALGFVDALVKARRDDAFLRAAAYLVENQEPNGKIPMHGRRDPVQANSFVSTTNSIFAFIQAFKETRDPRFKAAAERGLAWITAAKAETTQDKAFKVIALSRHGQPEQQRVATQIVGDLKAEQRKDGGWREQPSIWGVRDAPSGPYATGQVLCALKEAGVGPESPEFRRGVRFLLKHQSVTGAWPVRRTWTHARTEFGLTMWPVICLAGSVTEASLPEEGRLQLVSDIQPAKKPSKNLVIILDVSGSMNERLGKTTRWATALEVFKEVVEKLPDDFNVGLRVYAHRHPPWSRKSKVEITRLPTCKDTELLVPVGKLDRQRILSAIGRLKPRGETPLVHSVLQTAKDLKRVGGGSVVLITDGEETCGGDPLKASQELKDSGVDITLHIVGFAIKGKQVEQQLTTFAETTGGRYYSAQSGKGLARALMVAAVRKFPYQIFDAAGKEVAKGEADVQPEELPPGDYKVVVKAADQELVENVRLAAGTETVLKVVLKEDQFLIERR